MRIGILLIMLSLSIGAYGQDSLDVSSEGKENNTFTIACKNKHAVFKGGEKLFYHVYYKIGFLWFNVGKIIFKLKETPQTYILSARGYTFPSYSIVFPVDDYYKTILSKKTLRPLTSVKFLKEGNYRMYEKVQYDWVNNKAVITRGKSQNDTETIIMEIQPCIRDLLSLPYYLRVQDYTGLEIGEEIPIHLFIDKETYDLSLVYKKEVVKEIKDLGTYKTWKFTLKTVPGNTFGKKGSVLNAYVTEDKNKIPVYMESDIYIGSIKVILYKTENLKYPSQENIDQ